MYLAAVCRPGNASLPEIPDGVAARASTWVVVERFGAVVVHGARRDPCLEVATALLAKNTTPLPAAVKWSGGERLLCGTFAGARLTAERGPL
jgi:hypothetical protein